jgi:hypothetical protein
MRQAGPLGVQPVPELPAVGQVESVEERAGVGPNRGLQPILVQQALELADVGRHALRIEPEVVPGDQEHLLAEGAAQQVERIGEQAAAAVGVGLGPEERKDLVTAERPPPCQEGQEGELPAARGAPGHRDAGALDRGATQELERQHVEARERNAREPRERRDAAARD